MEKNCRVCEHKLQPFINFGKMPIANGFLSQAQVNSEYFFDLSVGFCKKCYTVQLLEQPEPSMMFHDNYAFFSQTSKGMCNHFAKTANSLMSYLDSNSFVVELGSNDGIFLQNFRDKQILHLGVEPSSNVADVAIANDINTVNDFFSSELACEIQGQYKNADLIYSANVMCHIPEINDVAKGISQLLSDKGILVFEDPYIGDVLEKTSYDQFYDEHVYIFGLHSVKSIFSKYGLKLFKVEHLDTHGGSMRYYLAKNRKIEGSVAKFLKYEDKLGIKNISTYQKFRENCETSRYALQLMLNDLSAQNKKIVGYAATSKSTTILNYCSLNKNHIKCIYDTTPIKMGKLTPGTHIPVEDYQNFAESAPDYAVLFAWNHSNEIFSKEQQYIANGGHWILFVPEVKIVA